MSLFSRIQTGVCLGLAAIVGVSLVGCGEKRDSAAQNTATTASSEQKEPSDSTKSSEAPKPRSAPTDTRTAEPDVPATIMLADRFPALALLPGMVGKTFVVPRQQRHVDGLLHTMRPVR